MSSPIPQDHPARAMSRRLWPMTVLLPVLLLGLAGCGGGGSAPAGDDTARPAGLATAEPGGLGLWARERLRLLDGEGRLAGSGGAVGAVMPVASPEGAAPPATSRTLVQEDGVDEADLLRTDGRHLHALVREGAGLALLAQVRNDDGTLGSARRQVLAADGGSLQPEGLLASDDGRVLAAVARRHESTPADRICETCITIAPVWSTPSVLVQRFDSLDAANPQPGTRLVIDGDLVDSRRIGNTLVVVAVHRPILAPQALPATASASERSAAIAAIDSDDLIPRLRRNGGAAQPLLQDRDCWLQTDNGSALVQLTTITLIDLASPELAQRSRCFAGGTEAVLLTQANLWVATTQARPLFERLTFAGAPPETDLHQFALDLTGTGDLAWRGSARVQGHLGWDAPRKSYRLSEHAGHLRVLSFTGDNGWATIDDAARTPGSPARLTVIRADSAGASLDGRTLAITATLPNERRPAAIGKPGEQVYAVRFVGERGYVVTFRQIDPLYVLDLSSPADPFIAGELELPGFSQVLLPLDNGLLLGLGREADDMGRQLGLQFTLFDVADATAPRVISSQVLGRAGSGHALEFARHGLALRADGSQVRAALPVMLTDGDWGTGTRSLQTFTIDTAARSLVLGTRLAEVDAALVTDPLAEERAVLIGEQAVLLRDGVLSAYDW